MCVLLTAVPSLATYNYQNILQKTIYHNVKGETALN